jgi:GNAT superfamily N-acetyltransferase
VEASASRQTSLLVIIRKWHRDCGSGVEMSNDATLRNQAMSIDIQPVTDELRPVAVELLVRFFREEGFATPPPLIAENLDRMLADPWCWCALAVADGEAQAVITVSTVLYIEWGRLGEIGDLYIVPQYRRRGLARLLVERAKDWCRAHGCSAVAVTITPTGEQHYRLSQFYARLGFEMSGRMSASAAL